MKTIKLTFLVSLLIIAELSHAQCCTNIYTPGKRKPALPAIVEQCKTTGFVFFMPQAAYEKYIDGKWVYGVPCDSDSGNKAYQFVIPYSQLEAIQDTIAYDAYHSTVSITSGIMTLLGTENWTGPVVYVVVSPRKAKKLSITNPRRGDCGTNNLFEPGGLTSGGCCEAYITQTFSCPDCAVYSLNTGVKLH